MVYWQCKALLLDEKERTMKKLLAALLALLLLTGCQRKMVRALQQEYLGRGVTS